MGKKRKKKGRQSSDKSKPSEAASSKGSGAAAKEAKDGANEPAEGLSPKQRTFITVALLAFVGLSVVVLVAKETGGGDGTSAEQPALAQGDAGAADPSSVTATSPEAGATETSQTSSHVATEKAHDTKIVVAYLHGNRRCGPCRSLQAYAAEAVKTHFSDELAGGTMEFRVQNVATPEHNHLRQRYGLYTQSVIVSELRNGQEVRWKNLDRIWELVRDRDAYFEYIQSEIEDFRSEQ